MTGARNIRVADVREGMEICLRAASDHWGVVEDVRPTADGGRVRIEVCGRPTIHPRAQIVTVAA